MSYMPLARACKETKRRNRKVAQVLVNSLHRPSTPPERDCRGPKISRQGEEERRRGQTALLLPPPTQGDGTTGSRISCGTCPRPTRRRPSGANRGQPPRAGRQPKSKGSGLGRARPRRRRRPADVRLRRRESDRRSKSPACIERAQHDAVPQTPPPPPPPPCGQAAPRRASPRRTSGWLRCGSTTTTRHRRAAGALAGRRVRPAAGGPQIPRERTKTRKHAAGLALPERPAPNADDGFMLGLMTAIGAGRSAPRLRRGGPERTCVDCGRGGCWNRAERPLRLRHLRRLRRRGPKTAAGTGLSSTRGSPSSSESSSSKSISFGSAAGAFWEVASTMRAACRSAPPSRSRRRRPPPHYASSRRAGRRPSVARPRRRT